MCSRLLWAGRSTIWSLHASWSIIWSATSKWYKFLLATASRSTVWSATCSWSTICHLQACKSTIWSATAKQEYCLVSYVQAGVLSVIYRHAKVLFGQLWASRSTILQGYLSIDLISPLATSAALFIGFARPPSYHNIYLSLWFILERIR